MSNMVDIDGALYIEVNKMWEEVYVIVSGTRLQAFKRIREDVPASKSNRSETVVMQASTYATRLFIRASMSNREVTCLSTTV